MSAAITDHSKLQEANALEWETRILEHLGYFDEHGQPRLELSEEIFEGGQLKPELLEKYKHLNPARDS